MNLTRNAQLIGVVGAAGAGAGLGAGLSAVSLNSADLLLTLGLALAAIGLLLVSAGWFWPRRRDRAHQLALFIAFTRLARDDGDAKKVLDTIRALGLVTPDQYGLLTVAIPSSLAERDRATETGQTAALAERPERAEEILEAMRLAAEEFLQEAERSLAETRR